MSLSISGTLMLELEDYCHLHELILEDHCHCHHFHCSNWKTTVIYKNSSGNSLSLALSTSGTLMLELEDYCHLQELFWKTTVTVITVIIRIRRLLSFIRTLLEDHCHCQHCH